ncbi:MAG: DUF559 domain-containing protein [Proteobacteria bacterium]|nr:DUF559 domain-containing protein [Pseudomonadota bacterium]
MRTKNHEAAARSQELRRAETASEARLWSQLRGRRLGGFKFVRQSSIEPYFADFLCRERKLIVEVDGVQHERSEHDARRDAFLKTQGYRVMRFTNARIGDDLDGVCREILDALKMDS